MNGAGQLSPDAVARWQGQGPQNRDCWFESNQHRLKKFLLSQELFCCFSFVFLIKIILKPFVERETLLIFTINLYFIFQHLFFQPNCFLLVTIQFQAAESRFAICEWYGTVTFGRERSWAIIMTENETILHEGPFLKKILLFSIPLLMSSIIQLLFNAIDMIVVGRYVGETALAAIGATSSINSLLITMFAGLSVGANVIVAHAFGARDYELLKKVIHTALSLALICSGILTIVGIIFSEPLLKVMGCPEEVLPFAKIYMRIYFGGVSGLILYNFGASILRALGNTKHPLFYLSFAGILNITLNLFFVLVCHAGVAGVALATVLAQFVSSGLVLRKLTKLNERFAFRVKELGISPKVLMQIVQVGVPAGLNSVAYMLSNVLIQSSINSFGTLVIAGNTAAANIEGFVASGEMAFQHTALSVSGQNVGAKKTRNVLKVTAICLLYAMLAWLIIGGGAVLFSTRLLGIYTTAPEVIGYGNIRIHIVIATYFICGIGDTLVGSIRGMGVSIPPMAITLLGVCAFRITWIYTAFASRHTLECLYVSYPISWCITAVGQILCFVLVYRRKCRREEMQIPIYSD